MRKLIMTAVFGHQCEKVFAEVSDRLNAYAAKIGASVLIIRDASGLGDGPHWEKCRIADYLDQGYSVLWIDADAIVAPWCPDLFELFPASLCDIALCDEVKCGYWQDRHPGLRGCVVKFAKTMGREFAFPCGDKSYYNTGVMVCHKDSAKMFRLEPGVVSDCVWEQSWLNLRLYETGVRVSKLPRAFNEMQFAGDIMHAAGVPWTEKIERMKRADTWFKAYPTFPCTLTPYA